MITRLWTFFSVIILILAIPITVQNIRSSQPQLTEQFAAGNTIFASPGDNLAAKASSLHPGDTLILNDGMYTNAHLLVNGVRGTVAAPITIKAAHDGKAVLDGGGNTANQGVIEVTNSSFIEIDGLVAQHGGQDVVGAYNTVDHITFRRITAHDAGPGNYHVFDMAYTGVTDILVEDCAGWGNGRYIFVAYHAANVTFRRTWARWTSQTNWSPAPRACYGVYNTSNESLENAICIHDIPEMNSPEYFTATWQNGNDNTKYLGVMYFNNWDGVYVNSGAGQNTQVINSYFANTRQQGTFTDSQNHGDAIYWLPTNTTGVVSNSTFVNNETGFNQHHGTTAISNSTFLNNDTATIGVTNHSNLEFFGNKSIGLAPTSTDKQVDPVYDISKYGQGAYLFVPPASPLKHAGTNGSDIGANIIYEYVNGQLTTTPLWPWPMEDRIKAEQGTSVTWETGGGLWKTLDGVYSNVPITPPQQTPSPTIMNSPVPTPTLIAAGSTAVATPTDTPVPTPCAVSPTAMNTPLPGITVSPTATQGITPQPGMSITPVQIKPSTTPNVTPGKKNDTDDKEKDNDKKKRVCHEEKIDKGILGGLADLFTATTQKTHTVCTSEKESKKQAEKEEHKNSSLQDTLSSAIRNILSFLFPGLISRQTTVPINATVSPCDTPSPAQNVTR